MTKSKTKKANYKQFFIILSLLSIISLLVILPTLSMESFFQGILIWATKVLPSLLPFFILTKLLSYTNFIPRIGKYLTPITQKLYGVGGVSGYVYVMSIISGYPVGAKITSELYNSRTISKSQAITITAFTSTSGPLFIIGTVGIGLFGSSKIGIIVLISHYLSSLINGLLYRNRESNTTQILSNKPIPNNPLNESMTSSILSIMTVGGFIALFYMIINILISINTFSIFTSGLQLLHIPQDISLGVISGLIEVTTGCIMLSKLTISSHLALLLLSFLISFGGLSIHFQAYCFLKTFEMPYNKFLLQKFTQAIISTLITAIIIIFI